MNFIKENLFIVLGVTLPLILIVFLSVVQTIQKASIEAPTYTVAYLSSQYLYNVNVSPQIDKKTKKLSINLTANNDNGLNNNVNLTIHLYHPDMGGTAKTYKFDLTELDLKKKVTQQLPLPKELKNLQFIDNKTSPDGYIFENNHYRSGNLMTAVFGYGSRNRKSAITKKGVRISLPKEDGWNNTKFIGWVEK